MREKVCLIVDLSALSIGLKVYAGFQYMDKIRKAMCKGTESGLNKDMEATKCLAHL